LHPIGIFLFACRFILGLCIGGDLVVVYTFVMEQLLPPQRMAIRGFFNWVFLIFVERRGWVRGDRL